MPGICPSFACSRKQIRHRSKSRMYPRFRPQDEHRRTTRDLNFGVRRDRIMIDFLAIWLLYIMELSHRESVTYLPYNPPASLLIFKVFKN